MDTTVDASPDSEASVQTSQPSTLDPSFGDVHPLDALPQEPDYDAPTGRLSRGLGSTRHTTSIVIALLAVPAGYGFLDYGFYRAVGTAQTAAPSGRAADPVLIALGAAAGCFLLAGLAGRISALGPLLAALVWGAAPAAWVLLDYTSYVQRLNDLPELWTHTGFGLNWAGFAVFPIVTGLMLGAAFSGRWRRPKPITRW